MCLSLTSDRICCLEEREEQRDQLDFVRGQINRLSDNVRERIKTLTDDIAAKVKKSEPTGVVSPVENHLVSHRSTPGLRSSRILILVLFSPDCDSDEPTGGSGKMKPVQQHRVY